MQELQEKIALPVQAGASAGQPGSGWRQKEPL